MPFTSEILIHLQDQLKSINPSSTTNFYGIYYKIVQISTRRTKTIE